MKPGRPTRQFQLHTCNDPTLWRYANVHEALRASVDAFAEAINTQTSVETAVSLPDDHQSEAISVRDTALQSNRPSQNGKKDNS